MAKDVLLLLDLVKLNLQSEVTVDFISVGNVKCYNDKHTSNSDEDEHSIVHVL